MVIPAVRKGFTYIGYKVYLLLLRRDGVYGVYLGRLLSWKDILTWLFYGFIGGVIGGLIFKETFGTVIGAAAMASLVDRELEEKASLTLSSGKYFKPGRAYSLSIPTPSIKYAELRVKADGLAGLKIKVGWRRMVFLVREEDAERLKLFLAEILDRRFRLKG